MGIFSELLKTKENHVNFSSLILTAKNIIKIENRSTAFEFFLYFGFQFIRQMEKIGHLNSVYSIRHTLNTIRNYENVKQRT